MKRFLITLLVSIIAVSLFGTASVGALSLKIAPLEYRVQLKSGEKQKGFIDVSNPTGQRVIVRSSTEAFTQIDDKGSLKFEKNEQLSSGVLLDLDEFELGPREAVRMYFLVDGTKLPSGDVFGAIFFTTTPANAAPGVGQSVRVGTILSIVNGTPGERKAEITSINMPWFLLGDMVQGTYGIKNTGDPKKSSGFYPNVKASVSPLGSDKIVPSSLVFAGRNRQNSFSIATPPLGIYRVQVAYGKSSKAQWVVVVHPIALALMSVILIATLGGLAARKRGFQFDQLLKRKR